MFGNDFDLSVDVFPIISKEKELCCIEFVSVSAFVFEFSVCVCVCVCVCDELN
jgi:hypothetical protein